MGFLAGAIGGGVAAHKGYTNLASVGAGTSVLSLTAYTLRRPTKNKNNPEKLSLNLMDYKPEDDKEE